MLRATYEIRIEGEVRPDVLAEIEGVTLVARSLQTTLRADLPDLAALYGLLNALRREGLILLDVRRDPVNQKDAG